MDIDERLSLLLRDCRWVCDPGTASALLPALGAEAPALVPLPQRDGEARPAVPVVCLPELAGPVALAVVAAVERGGGSDGLENKTGIEAAEDPLVAVYADFFNQTSRPGLRSQLVPVLATAHVVWQVLNGRADSLPGIDADVAQAARTAAARVQAASGTERAQLLSGIGWALSARIAAGAGLASLAGAPVALGGLYRQILPNPLVMGCPRGTLDLDPAAAAPMLGLSLEPALVQGAAKAASWLLEQSRERVSGGSAEPFDAALQAVIPEDLDPAAAPFHPTAGPALIAALPTLATAKQLTSLGLSKSVAKGLTAARGARALSAAWRKLTEGLGRWDVLSSLVARVVPIHLREGRWVGPDGALPPDARWSMLVPRGNASGTVQAVVAVRSTELGQALIGALGPQPWALRNVEQAWVKVARQSGASVRQRVGDHFVAAFPVPELAIRFARRVQAALGPEAKLELVDRQQRMAIPPSASIGIGLAIGPVLGGTDGENSWLAGRGVSEAVALAGNGKATRVVGDVLGIREAGFASDGLVSETLVASGAIVRAVLDRAQRRNRPVHVRNAGGMCGGLGDDFELAPVAGWWEVDDSTIAAALLLDGDSEGGAAELRMLSAEELREWHGSDRSSAKLQREAEEAARRRSRRPAGGFDAAEPSGGDAPAATGFSLSSDFDDDDDVGGFDAPSHSFMGFEPKPTEAPSAEDTRDPITTDGFLSPPEPEPEPEPEPHIAPPMMMVGDDEDDAAPSFGFAPVNEGPSAPLLLEEDDDEPVSFGGGGAPAPPMMLDDDGGDPFADDFQSDSLQPVDSAFGPAGSSSESDGSGSALSMLHSSYEGEMQLVGVAGFSMTDGESRTGSDPFHDPEDDTGFYDSRVSAQPRRPDPAPARPSGQPPDAAMVRELVRLLRGYVVVRDGANVTFGLPDGSVLRDAWAHDGSLDDAYISFLQSKVAEGFIPRADRTVALVAGAVPQPIDPAAIERAASQAGL